MQLTPHNECVRAFGSVFATLDFKSGPRLQPDAGLRLPRLADRRDLRHALPRSVDAGLVGAGHIHLTRVASMLRRGQTNETEWPLCVQWDGQTSDVNWVASRTRSPGLTRGVLPSQLCRRGYSVREPRATSTLEGGGQVAAADTFYSVRGGTAALRASKLVIVRLGCSSSHRSLPNRTNLLHRTLSSRTLWGPARGGWPRPKPSVVCCERSRRIVCRGPRAPLSLCVKLWSL